MTSLPFIIWRTKNIYIVKKKSWIGLECPLEIRNARIHEGIDLGA